MESAPLPITPEFVRGNEVYRYRDIHRVELKNGMYHVGNARYLPQPRSHLYVFKQRSSDFSFRFRGQEILVPTQRPWIPSVYYYAEDEDTGKRVKLTREFLRVGRTQIEIDPGSGTWLVNGKTYHPEAKKALTLYGVAR